MQIYDESDRRASYMVQAKANRTLVRYTRRRMHHRLGSTVGATGRRLGRLSVVGPALK